MELRSGPSGSRESLPVLWLDGVCNQIRRLSHRAEVDESSDLVCYGLGRVVERKAPLCLFFNQRMRAATNARPYHHRRHGRHHHLVEESARG